MDNKGRTSSYNGRVGRRVQLSEIQSQLISCCEGVRAEDIRFSAEVNTAELNAVFSGNKPAFLEPIPGYVLRLAREMPAGCFYARAVDGLDCIYNAAAVAEEYNLSPGADVHAFVEQKLEEVRVGRLLGYGMETIVEYPRYSVSILRNGELFSGFFTVSDRTRALQYAEARIRDFKAEYPEDVWDAVLTYQQ